MDIEKSGRQAWHPAGRSAARRRWRCPDDARLAAFADGRLDGSVRARTQSHLAHCDFCLQQVVFLHEDDQTLPEVPADLMVRAREVARRRASWSFPPLWRWATLLAATASVAFIISVQLRIDLPPVPAPARPVATPPALVSAVRPPSDIVTPRTNGPQRRSSPQTFDAPAILYPSENLSLHGDDVRVRWKGISSAVFYEVRISAADGQLIWEARAEQLNVRVPAEVQFDAGPKYYVWVVAYSPEGKSLQSKAIAFRITK